MNQRTVFVLPFVFLALLLVALLALGLPPSSEQTALAAESVGDSAAQIAQEVTRIVTVEVTRVVTVVVTPTATPLPPTATPLAPEDTVDDDPFIGAADAPVKVVEFSDYQCGFCRRFYDETLFPLTDRYGDLIQFVYRDFPIFGQPSIEAAIAAECSGDQDQYWGFHNAIFDSQASSDRPELNRATFSAIAVSLELDLDAWNACFDDEATYNEVIADAIDGDAWGVTGTPTFFINGQAIVGAQPYEVFVQIIDAELVALGIEPPDEG